MPVLAFEAMFHALSNYATQLFTIEDEKVKIFIKCLNYDPQVLSIHMASTWKCFN